MSKIAEEAALKAYPERMEWSPYGPIPFDANYESREKFQEGYEQAEKDLELTWRDMRAISRIIDKMVDEDVQGDIPEQWDDEGYYGEVLRRFNEWREKK